MKAVFNLSNFIRKLPDALVHKLRPNPLRRSELSMKLAGVGSSNVTLTSWRTVDSEKRRWNDPLPYSQYRLPRLEVQWVPVDNHRPARFSEYFLPHPVQATGRQAVITAVDERLI